MFVNQIWKQLRIQAPFIIFSGIQGHIGILRAQMSYRYLKKLILFTIFLVCFGTLSVPKLTWWSFSSKNIYLNMEEH